MNEKPIHEQSARFAIDGAIAYGRMGINQPHVGHWLTEYWHIGQQLAELGKTSAWDNQTLIPQTDDLRYSLRDALAGVANCIGDPMWADHAEVSKFNLKRWHKAMHDAAAEIGRKKGVSNGNG